MDAEVPESGLPETGPDEGLSLDVGPALHSEKPRQFLHIPEEIFNSVATFLPAVIAEYETNRNVDVAGILENGKYMFSEGTRRNDRYWMQHCAASLRELVMWLGTDHFYSAYKSIDGENPQVEKAIAFIVGCSSYLSEVVHHVDSNRMGKVDTLYPKQGFGQMDKEDFLKAEKRDVFERICIDMVYELHTLFSEFVKGN